MHINIQKMIWKNKWQNDDLWEDGRVGSKGTLICNALKNYFCIPSVNKCFKKQNRKYIYTKYYLSKFQFHS